MRAPMALNPNRVWQSHYLPVLCCSLTAARWRNRALNGQVVLAWMCVGERRWMAVTRWMLDVNAGAARSSLRAYRGARGRTIE
ncbi:Cyanuric acid amidohydrolase, partial [Dissostichus eleginoides]